MSIAHQFDDLTQQRDAYTLGMWGFLVTEVLLFGALFTAFAVYRLAYHDGFAAASAHLLTWAGGINTAVLLGSSFTMALAVRAAHEGERQALTTFLIVTALLGMGFLGIKAFEYYTEFREGLVPAGSFRHGGPNLQGARLFFAFYFVMTGLHALHLLTGIAAVVTIAVLARAGRFSARHYAPVELVGLFWHFIDVVWIFLFPMLYLIRR